MQRFVRDLAYFLVCIECGHLDGVIADNGLSVELIHEPVQAIEEQLSVYRVTPAPPG
jgi:hypothetical protein